MESHEVKAMSQDKEQRTGSVGEFMRDYSAYIIPILIVLFFAMKDKIAGGLPELEQAQAKTQTIIDKQAESIAELKTSDAVTKNEMTGLKAVVEKFDTKLDRILRERRHE